MGGLASAMLVTSSAGTPTRYAPYVRIFWSLTVISAWSAPGAQATAPGGAVVSWIRPARRRPWGRTLKALPTAAAARGAADAGTDGGAKTSDAGATAPPSG